MRRSLLALALALALPTGAAAAPVGPELHKEAGNEYLSRGRYAEARDAYLAALRADPEYADAHYNLGLVYFFRLGDYPRALHHFARYATLSPDAPDLDRVRELAIQALERVEAEERGDYARALEAGTAEALEAFLEAHPGTAYADDAREELGRLR